MSERSVPVLVAGGSLVGLSTALLLAHHGVPALVVEQLRGGEVHPRAARFNQRTMEILRAAGLEAAVRETAERQFVQDGAVVAVESLAGAEIGTFSAELNEGVRDVSPCARLFITQSMLESLIAARARELGAEIRFAAELAGVTQDADGVTATIAGVEGETETTETIRAQYLVAADGARSGVRERLKIGTSGRGVFGRGLTIYFRAPLAPLVGDRRLSLIYVNHPEVRGVLRLDRALDRGWLSVTTIGDREQPAIAIGDGVTEDHCQEWVRLALGADLPIIVENVMAWSSAADSAETYQSGRIFLAGDAAHVMPPHGAFGGNTGVQDAHNLAWKIAMVLRGKAGPAVLATYDAERRPVGAFTAEQAYARYVAHTAPHLSVEGVPAIVPDLEVEMGYGYDSDAVCGERRPVPAHADPRHTKGRPGTRAPHVWLRRDGERISTLDLFGRRFVLLAGPQAAGWCDAARAVADQQGVPLDIHRMGADGLEDADRRFLDAYGLLDGHGLAARGAVLVRPDGVVGWRAKTPAASPAAVAGALAQLTFRDQPPD